MGTARCDHGSESSFGEDLAIARRAIGEGDPGHAAFHLACALSVDARHADALALADQVIAGAPDPDSLVVVEDGTYFGLVAFHCRVLAHQGKRSEAVERLAAVVAMRPDVGYATWLPPWLDGASAPATMAALERISRGVGDAGEVGRGEAIAAAEHGARVHPDDDRVACMYGKILRAAGRIPEALAVLAAADARHRTYMTGVVLATTHRIAGDREAAVALLRDLCERFPTDDALCLDLGDNLLDLDRFTDAVDAYQRVCDRDPHHDWAHPSVLYARFLATGEGTWRDQLEDLAQIPGAKRAGNLARAITPYLGYLPTRPESILKIGEQLRASPPSGSVSVGQTSLEAPSVVFALERFLATHGATLSLATRVNEPDPRVPRRPVSFLTWTYADTVATPAMPPPPARIGEALARVANQRYDGARWLEDARAVATELGAGAAADIIAAMVHGSPAPDWASPLSWGWRLQVAGALVLAVLDTGWDDSVRRRALVSLIDGPVDTVASAALVALTRLCDVEPALVAVVAPILDDAAAVEVSPIHYMCLVEPAVRLLVQLPGASPSQRAARRARRSELD